MATQAPTPQCPATTARGATRWRQELVRLAAFATLLWTAACAASAGDEPQPTDTIGADAYDNYKQPPQAVVGGALDHGAGFVPWTETSAPLPTDVTVISGPQGGQHIWVSVRTKGLWPSKARVGVQFVDVASGEVVKPGRVDLIVTLKTDPTEREWLVYEAMPAFIKEPCAVRDRPLRAELLVIDLYGRTLQDTALVVPKWNGWCATEP